VIKTTDIPRCTIIRDNLITENNNLTVAAVGNPAGTRGSGIVLPGDYADLIEQNIIAGNETNGEYPNPFPPEADTIFSGLAGNRVSNNIFVHNGYDPTYKGNAFAGDLTLTGGYGELLGGA
jgi:hypothetical protein